MNNLVQQLSQEQEVEVRLRSAPTPQSLKAAFDRGYIHARFPNTRGGTELGVSVDPGSSDLQGADFERGAGSIKIVGHLVLDYTKVRFHATFDLATLKGTGHLEPLEDMG